MCHGWGSVVIHHAHPQSARHGLAWYELDPNWYGIFALRMLGLAWDIKLPRPHMRGRIITSCRRPTWGSPWDPWHRIPGIGGCRDVDQTRFSLQRARTGSRSQSSSLFTTSSPSLLYGPRLPIRFSAASVASPPELWLNMVQTICKKSMTQETSDYLIS